MFLKSTDTSAVLRGSDRIILFIRSMWLNSFSVLWKSTESEVELSLSSTMFDAILWFRVFLSPSWGSVDSAMIFSEYDRASDSLVK